MAITNRDNDLSQQRMTYQFIDNDVFGVSTLNPLGLISSAQVLVSVNSAAIGLSGSPIMGLQISRFLPGLGQTVIPLNGSSLLTIAAYSTSGIQKHAIGTTVQLIAGDWLQYITSGANTAASYHVVATTQALQDIRSDYGV